MLSLTVLISALAITSAKPSWKDLKNYSFEQYLEDFRYNIKSSEFDLRRSIFEKEIARIIDHNAKDLSWKEGVNKFTLMTEEEKKQYFGYSKTLGRHHKRVSNGDHSLPKDFKLKEMKDLPKSVDWRDSGILTAVKDQGKCGSCWAFASTETIESHVALNSGILFDLSVQQMTSCTPNPNNCGGSGGCLGATAELAYDYVTNSTGMYEEYQVGYVSYYGNSMECEAVTPRLEAPVVSINGYVQLTTNNYEELMNAVARVGPISVSVDASNWHSYEEGIYNGCNQESPDIDHLVMLVGYGEEDGTKYWLIRNQWSPNWGEKGYMKLYRTEETQCGMDVTPQDGSACDGETDPIEVCGTCGILYDNTYPLDAKALQQ